jgi:hypothetical protein
MERGCRPCSFVCDCCCEMKYRCGHGEPMWVRRSYSSNRDYNGMWCDSCYHYWTVHGQCPCQYHIQHRQSDDFQGHRESDRKVCMNFDQEKCADCYFTDTPCVYCFHNKLWNPNQLVMMTYEEFCSKWIKMRREPIMPSFEEFVKHSGHPPRPTYADVVKRSQCLQ